MKKTRFFLTVFLSLIILGIAHSAHASYATTSVISVGSGPRYITRVSDKLYVSNANAGTVSVIDTTTDTVTATITVGTTPQISIAFGTYVYVVNNGSDDISVIDTTSNTVVATLAVNTTGGNTSPFGLATDDSYVYVSASHASASGTMDIIDPTTNTITATSTISPSPLFMTRIGTNLYNKSLASGTGYVSVFDTVTRNQTDLIELGVGVAGYYLLSYNDLLYVTNNDFFGSVYVVDPDSKTVVTTVAVGSLPTFMIGYGDYVYIGNQLAGTVSVLDINTNTIVDTINSGGNPNYFAELNDMLFVADQSEIDIIDPSTNEVSQSISVGSSEFLLVYNNKVYATGANEVVVIEETDETAPVLQSATSTSNTITLTYNETLATTTPATADYTISINGTTVNPSSVTIGTTTVTLELSSTIYQGDTVTISYTAGANPVEDTSGNNAVNLSNQSVTNTSTEDEPVAENNNSGGNSSKSSHRRSEKTTVTSNSSSHVSVEDSCPFLTGFYKKGDTGSGIFGIQFFLNFFEQENLSFTAVFDQQTEDAVKRFQQKYRGEILDPWNLPAPTGFWYQSTSRQANILMGCPYTITLDNGVILE